MNTSINVTLTVDELRALVRAAVREELGTGAGASDVMTREEAAALLKVHPKVIVSYVRKGLPAKRLGREWRFRRSEILRWLESHAVNSGPKLRAIKGGA